MKYQRNPTIIDAEQFDPTKPRDDWPKSIIFWNDETRPHGEMSWGYVITIHGSRSNVDAGDWIVPEPDGTHYYNVKDEIFKKSYSPLGDNKPLSHQDRIHELEGEVNRLEHERNAQNRRTAKIQMRLRFLIHQVPTRPGSDLPETGEQDRLAAAESCLRRCAVVCTEITADDEKDMVELQKAMEHDLLDVDNLVNERFAEMECRLATTEARLRGELRRASHVESL